MSQNRKTFKSGGTRSRPLKRLNRCSSTDTDSETEQNDQKFGKTLSRNAIMARMNRIKKKNYLMTVENDLRRYKEEAENFKEKVVKQNEIINALRGEVIYLRNVLANSTQISALLKSTKVCGIPVTTSLKVDTRIKVEKNEMFTTNVDLASAAIPDHEYTIPSPTSDLALSDILGDMSGDDLFPDLPYEPAGICLHLNKNRASVEFCSQCNNKAAAAWEIP